MTEAQIVDALRSGDVERQARALDEAARIVKKLISESVRALADAEAPFPIAARLHAFGPLIIPRLVELLGQPIKEDTRNHAAALLVELGSTAGVPHLLCLLERHDKNSVMAALVLGKARILEAAPQIRRVLEQWDCGADPYSATTLIDALQKSEYNPRFTEGIATTPVAQPHERRLGRNSAVVGRKPHFRGKWISRGPDGGTCPISPLRIPDSRISRTTFTRHKYPRLFVGAAGIVGALLARSGIGSQ
jgi:hypothetical protein